MYEIYIVSSDAVFARMLELDLSSEFRGAKASVVNCGQTFSPADSVRLSEVLVISDLALLTRRMKGLLGLVAVNCGGASDTVAPYMPERPDLVLTRPFRMSALRSFISERLGGLTAAESESDLPDGVESGLRIDVSAKTVAYSGADVSLTGREFELLSYLFSHRGEPVSREELIREVWRYNYTGDTNVVDVYIRYLREKFDEPFGVKLILTVRGKGYMIK